jgi:ribosome biogenesis GTPase
VDALVLAVHNQFAAVRADGEERVATIAGRLRRERPVVGDRVELRILEDGSARIESVHERRGTLLRGGFRNWPQVVASNVDLLVVVAAVVDPPLRPGLIDRYLVAAWRDDIKVAVALTKTDLPHDPAPIQAERALLARLGHAVVDVSVTEGKGVDKVRALIGSGVAVLSGHSGVGKTTLSNELTGRADPVGVINEVIGRGRHTTTIARYIDLPGGGAIIDTAGIRSFGIVGVKREDLQDAFPEIAEAGERCKWQPCLHEGRETGCAVPSAVSPERLASYRRVLADLPPT